MKYIYIFFFYDHRVRIHGNVYNVYFSNNKFYNKVNVSLASTQQLRILSINIELFDEKLRMNLEILETFEIRTH